MKNVFTKLHRLGYSNIAIAHNTGLTVSVVREIKKNFNKHQKAWKITQFYESLTGKKYKTEFYDSPGFDKVLQQENSRNSFSFNLKSVLKTIKNGLRL